MNINRRMERESKFHLIGHNAQGNLYKIATSLEFPMRTSFNPLSASFTKWSNTLKQFVGKLATNCLSVFDHFVGLALKGLSCSLWIFFPISLFCSVSIILISLYDVKYNGKRQFVDS